MNLSQYCIAYFLQYNLTSLVVGHALTSLRQVVAIYVVISTDTCGIDIRLGLCHRHYYGRRCTYCQIS